MKRIAYCLFLILACAVVTTRASAVAACTVSSSGTGFGTFDTLSGSNKDVIGIVTVTCTGNIGDSGNYTIALSPGGGSFVSRTMLAGGNQLNYNVYSDAGHNSIWGDGTGGTSTVNDTYALSATTYAKDYTVYGEIPGPQHGALVGSYADTIVVTLTYF